METQTRIGHRLHRLMVDPTTNEVLLYRFLESKQSWKKIGCVVCKTLDEACRVYRDWKHKIQTTGHA